MTIQGSIGRGVLAVSAALCVLLGAFDASVQRMPGTSNQVASCSRNCDADCRAHGFGSGARVPNSLSIRMQGFCNNRPFIVCECAPPLPPPPPPPPPPPEAHATQHQAEAVVETSGRTLIQACFAQNHAAPTPVTLDVVFAPTGAVQQATVLGFAPDAPLAQ